MRKVLTRTRATTAMAMAIAMPTFLAEPWAWTSSGDAVFPLDVEEGNEVEAEVDVAVALTGRPVRSCDARDDVGASGMEVSKTTELVCCGAGDILAVVEFVSEGFSGGEW